jgi:hypothetical protein
MKNKFSIAMSLAVMMAMLLTSLALADNVVNDVVAGGNDTITAGGSTVINYQIKNTNSNNSTDPQNSCNPADSTPATVTINTPAGVTVDTSGAPGNQVTLTFTSCETNRSATFSSSTPGDYTITVSVSDSGTGTYNTSPATFTLHVNAPTNTAPSLSLPGNITAEATSAAGAVVTYTATAADAQDDPDPTPTCSPASGSTFSLGTTTVNCSVTDSGGMSASGSFTVTVRDTTAPTVTVPANITAEATGPSGAAVSFTASASDLVDGAITPSCSPASGSTFALGTTTVNCSATDAAGNTGSASFSVTVRDTTPPSVTVPANMTVEATGPSGAVATFSASASDLVDGSLAVTCSPASGSTFPLGTTTVNCSATDAAGNIGSGSFSVSVVDTTPPTVTVPANIILEATGPSGAVATFSASASDLVDGSLAVTCSPASGSTFPLGTTTVNCSATDAAGNTGSNSFTVKVQDTTAPTLTLPSNMTVSATSAAGAVVSYSASATDIVDGSVAVSCSPASGSTFAPGTTTINCSATDAAGNTATGSFTISVTFRLSGFYQPVDMNNVVNTVRGGATVPLKFEVFAGSTELTATSVVKSFVQTRISCDTSATIDEIEVTTTGGTSLRYDTTAGQFIQNWQTPRQAGACYRVTLTTQDDSSLVALFKLK